MLRSEHSIVRYDFDQAKVEPDRLRRGRHDGYLRAAQSCLELYRGGIGQTRQSLHRRVEEILSRLGDCPPRRVAAFCKLLDDRGEFDSNRRAAIQLRQKVFRIAGSLHPIVSQREGIFEHDTESARRWISEAVGLSWPEIESRLFGDVIELQRLLAFATDMEPRAFLSSYNVAQTQAALYRAIRVRIDAYEDLKVIARHTKLAGLMHHITRLETDRPGYRFVLNGPSSNLRQTTRYGIKFAAMLPILLSCRSWALHAEILGPNKRPMRLAISPRDGLQCDHLPPIPFDSQFEADVDAYWREHPVPGWTWRHESELLTIGQSVLTPDFVLSRDRRAGKIYVEVVGYWTPEYLQEKRRRLEQFTAKRNPNDRWLLVFPQQSHRSKVEALISLGLPMIVFDKKSSTAQWISTAYS